MLSPTRQTLRDHDAPNVQHYPDRFQPPPFNKTDFE